MQSGDSAAAAERAVYAGNGFLAGGLRQRRRVWRVVVLVGGVGWLLHTRRRGRLRARRVWAMRLGGRMRVVERGGHGLHWGGRVVCVGGGGGGRVCVLRRRDGEQECPRAWWWSLWARSLSRSLTRALWRLWADWPRALQRSVSLLRPGQVVDVFAAR